MPFVGRERELRALEHLYEAGTFQMPVIYGRRRVGKTSLINKFIEGKPAAVFTARESSAKENLVALSKAVAELSQGDDLAVLDAPVPVFESFDAAFEQVFRIARTRRVIFVIDEYPYLAQSYRPVSSLLQAKIDDEKDESGLYLVLCGSSMSFMEHQVLGYQSPLYGRGTAQIKVEPFDMFDSAKLLRGLSVSAAGGGTTPVVASRPKSISSPSAMTGRCCSPSASGARGRLTPTCLKRWSTAVG